MREQIVQILKDQGMDPSAKLDTGATAYEFLEAAILGALDEIEENLIDN